jgi:ElaB/YqjD/DUF883 family membrane-anchored ribosome-binding protein
VKTIQINLGGMKAAELRGSCVKTHSATKIRTLFSDPSTVRYSREEENQQLVNLPQPLTSREKEKSIMEENEKRSLLGKGMHVGERLAEVGGEAARLTTAASHAVEDAVTEAKRLAKRSRYAAEDLLEDAAHRVKRDPLRSVALGLAIGLGMGALAVWVATRNARE